MLSLLVLLLFVVTLWWVWVNPYNFQFTESKDYSQQGSHRVFAFGTLTNPVIRILIMRAYVPTEPAVLTDFRRQGLDLCADPSAETEGLLFHATSRQLKRLDRYERLGIKYQRDR